MNTTKPIKRRQIATDEHTPVIKKSKNSEEDKNSFEIHDVESNISVDRSVERINHNHKDELQTIFSELSNEIACLMDVTLISKGEVELIKHRIISDLNFVIRNTFLDRRWHAFGSFANDLACKGSDLDLYFQYPVSYTSAAQRSPEISVQLTKMLRRSSLFYRVINIRHARVPLIKLVHRNTNIECDLSFSSELGVRNSLLMKIYVNINENLKHLVLFLKHLLKKYDLHGSGRFTTYVVFWMAVYFMQQKKLLPPAVEIREAASEKYYVYQWDCSLPTDFCWSFPTESPSLFVLLIEFLNFYSEFNFLNHVICPFLGRTFLLEDFITLNIPRDVFTTYCKDVETGNTATFGNCVLNIQDPSEHSLNMSKFLDAVIVSKFKFFCNYLQKVLTQYKFKLGDDRDSILKMLPESIPFDNHTAKDADVSQISFTRFDYRSVKEHYLRMHRKSEFNYVISVLHHVMTTTLEFEVDRVSSVNVPRISEKKPWGRGMVPVAFLNYRTESNVWKYFNRTDISKSEKENSLPESVSVSFTCIGRPEKRDIQIYAHSRMKFIKFLRRLLNKLLCLEIEKQTPVKPIENTKTV